MKPVMLKLFMLNIKIITLLKNMIEAGRKKLGMSEPYINIELKCLIREKHRLFLLLSTFLWRII